MAALCLGALAVTAAVSTILGGDSATTLRACAAVGIGSIASFIPVLLASTSQTGASNFGVLVVVASGARTLITLAAALFFTQMQSLAKVPLWVGAMAGAGLILIVETALTVSILSRIERAKSSQAGGATTQTLTPGTAKA